MKMLLSVPRFYDDVISVPTCQTGMKEHCVKIYVQIGSGREQHNCCICKSYQKTAHDVLRRCGSSEVVVFINSKDG